MAARSEFLRRLPDILPIDEDAARFHVVETIEEARHRGFASARRADQRNHMPRRHFEIDAAQDRARRVIGEMHILEADRAFRHDKRLCARLVLDLGRAAQQRKHRLDIDERLLRLAIDHAHHVQRLVELDEYRVHHHEIADRHGSRGDALRGQQHGEHHPHGEDQCLHGIQHRKRTESADGGALVSLHGAVEPGRLPALIAEIFDGLVIQKAVHGLLRGVLIRLDIFAADLDALVAVIEAEPGVDHDHDANDRDHFPAEIITEQKTDEDRLKNGWNKVQRDHANDEFYRVLAAVEHARKPARLPLQVKAQRKIVHMAEGLRGEHARCVLPHISEQHIAQLHEADHGDARHAIGDDQHQRNGRKLRRLGRFPGLRQRRHRIHRALVGERHEHGNDLGGKQRYAGQHKPQLQIRPSLRPHEGHQVLDDVEMLLVARAFRLLGRMKNGEMSQ